MKKIVEFLKGRKTYLVCLVGILTAVLGYLNTEISLAQAVEAIFIAIGGMTLRAGVSK